MVGLRTFCLGRHILPEAFKTSRLPNPDGAFPFLPPFFPTPNHHTHTPEQLEKPPSRCSKSSPPVACPRANQSKFSLQTPPAFPTSPLTQFFLKRSI